MSTYAKDTKRCPSVLVTRKTETENIELGAPAPKEIQKATKQRATKQKVPKVLAKNGKSSVYANALSDYHTNGIKMPTKRCVRTNKHIPVRTPDKEERAKEIRERRVRTFQSKNWMAPIYESFGFDFGVKEATIESFSKLFNVALDKFKTAVNNNKNILEHVIKLDADTLSAIVQGTSVIAISIAFVVLFKDCSTFVKFLLCALPTALGIWSNGKKFMEYLSDKLLTYITGRDVNAIIERDRIECAEMEDEVMSYFNRALADLENSSQPVSTSDTSEDYYSVYDFLSTGKFRYQGLFDSGMEPIFHVLGEIASTVCTMIGGFMITKTNKNLVKSMLESYKLRGDLQCIFTEALSWISKQLDKMLGTSFSNVFGKTKELDVWGNEVSELYTTFSSGTLEMNSENARRVNFLLLRGIELAKKHESMSASSWAYHRFCTSMINKMENVLGAAGVPLSERQVPLTICLRGESGIGKSYITHALIDEIAMRVLKGAHKKAYNENHLNEKYMWLSEEEHANGYNGQFCTIFDDFGQFLTQKGQADDFMRIIRMANAAPCRLNAAELERKGKVVFTSPLVICSTNLYQFWPVSLAKPEALVRRFDLWVEMVPRKEFCTEKTRNSSSKKRRLDRSLLKNKIEYDACEYRILRCNDAEQQIWTHESTLTFSELVDLCASKYRNHRDNHHDLMDALRKRREQIMRDDEPEYEGWFDWIKKPVLPAKTFVRDTFTSLKQKMIAEGQSMYIKYKLGQFKITLRCIIAIFGVIASVYISYKVYQWCTRKPKALEMGSYEAELLEGRGDNSRLYHNMIMRSILDRNVYHMFKSTDDHDEENSVGKVTMITGTKGLINYHYISQLKTLYETGNPEYKFIKLVSHKDPRRVYNVDVSWITDPDHYSYNSASDLAMIQFDDSFPVCRDIRKHFVTTGTVERNRDFNTALFAPKAPRCLDIYDITKRKVNQTIKIGNAIHADVILYEADTQTGDCGSLLAFTGDYANGVERICGIHMAGVTISGKKFGFATTVTQELIEDLLVDMVEQPTIHAPIESEGTFHPSHDLCHDVVKKVERPLFAPMATAIVPSLIQGMMGPITKRPAMLAPTNIDGVKVSPLINCHVRQHSFNTQVDTILLDYVVADVIEQLRPMVKHTNMLLTNREAVEGHSELKCLGAIPRQTSAGYSYKDDPRVRNGKKEFFGFEGDYTFDSELANDVFEKVDRIVDQARDLIVPEDRVYCDILKDETLPLAKVAIAKTRMISACDLPMSIVYRKYYGALCNDLVATRIINGIAVGINPYGREWEFLSRFLGGMGDKVIAGDFSGYDNSQSCQLIQAVMKVMSELTGHQSEDDKRAMRSLSVTLSQPYHISGNTIYELDHGMPSGNPMTTIMNSIFGLIAFRLCWLSCTYGEFSTPGLSLQAFNQNVRLVMYGDDNLLNVSNQYIHLFNQNTMMSHFPKFGLKYTSDQKDDENPPAFRKIGQVTFLKRTFVHNDVLGRVTCPLERATIQSMLDWTKKGGCANSITLDNCKNALREWSLHGKECYESQSSKLAQIVKDVFDTHLSVAPYNIAVLETVGYVPEWIKDRQ